MENCIFCKIVAGEIPSPRLYEDEQMIVIRDIEPKAKLHYLCIPKTHFALLSEMDAARAEIVKHCFEVIPTLEEKLVRTSLILLVLSNWLVAFWNLRLKSSFFAATNSSFNSAAVFAFNSSTYLLVFTVITAF